MLCQAAAALGGADFRLHHGVWHQHTAAWKNWRLLPGLAQPDPVTLRTHQYLEVWNTLSLPLGGWGTSIVARAHTIHVVTM